jgi:hypothetical protein
MVLNKRFCVDGLTLILTLAVLAVLYWACVDDQIIGFTRDDGIYALTAKAMASGHGFTLPHLPGTPAQIRYPFGYPLLLALGWLINPQFPANMPLLHALTIGFTLAGLGMVFATVRWLKQGPTWLASLITLLVGGNFYFVFAGTQLLSEGPYLFWSVLTVFIAGRLWGQATKPSLRSVVLIAALSVITFHTRTMGLVLILAVALWLLSRRFYKAMGLYSLGCFLLGPLPWFWWVNTHQPANAMSAFTFIWFNPYTDYSTAFKSLFSLGMYWPQLVGSTGMFFHNFLETFFPFITTFLQVYAQPWHLLQTPYAVKAFVVFQLLCSYALPGFFILKGISVLRVACVKRHLQGLSIVGLYVAGYLLLTLLWNFESQMARFIAMVSPWLWCWLLLPVVNKLTVPWQKAVVPVVLIGLLFVLNLYPSWVSVRFLAKARHSHWVDGGEFPDLWPDYQAAYQYIKTSTPPKALVATAFEMPLALYSGHPVLNMYLTNLPISFTRNNSVKQSLDILMQGIDHFKVRYLLLDPQQQDHKVQETDNSVIKDLIARYPKRFRLVYLAPNSFVSVYQVLNQ